MRVVVTLGRTKLEFKARSNRKGIVEWNQGDEVRKRLLNAAQPKRTKKKRSVIETTSKLFLVQLQRTRGSGRIDDPSEVPAKREKRVPPAPP